MNQAISFLFFILPLGSVAQNPAKGDLIQNKITREASFPGGLPEWKNYIEKSMAGIEIDSADWDGSTITLIVSFIIEKDGSLSGISVLNAKNSRRY